MIFAAMLMLWTLILLSLMIVVLYAASLDRNTPW